MTKTEEALNYFKDGFSCSQAVLCSFAKDFGLEEAHALKLSGSFGGGVARMNSMCGAVSGALMVIGLKYGKTDAANDEQKELNYKNAQQFATEFKLKNKSVMCTDLLGVDLSNPEAGAYMKKNNLSEIVCRKAIRDAIEVLEQIL